MEVHEGQLGLVPTRPATWAGAVRNGNASVATDRIRSFTETGVQLEAGEELAANIIVTATGLNLQRGSPAGLGRRGQLALSPPAAPAPTHGAPAPLTG